ncbi:MAG: hypothetical protein M1379_15775 [Firmicutes bacterium]|nr:hypothetical protein [Bacillota bacterium]
MSQAERFLEAEQKAKELVASLKALQKEISSYQTATKELDLVRQGLLDLVQSTGQAAEGTSEAIRVLRSIGGPEILSHLEKLSQKTEQNFAQERQVIAELFSHLEELSQKTEQNFAQERRVIAELFSALETRIGDSVTKVIAELKKSRTLILVNVGLSGVAVLLGIIALVR